MMWQHFYALSIGDFKNVGRKVTEAQPWQRLKAKAAMVTRQINKSVDRAEKDRQAIAARREEKRLRSKRGRRS